MGSRDFSLVHHSESTDLYKVLFVGEADLEYQEMSGNQTIGSIDKLKQDFYQMIFKFFSSFSIEYAPKSIQEIEVEERRLKIDKKERDVICFFYGVSGGLRCEMVLIAAKC